MVYRTLVWWRQIIVSLRISKITHKHINHWGVMYRRRDKFSFYIFFWSVCCKNLYAYRWKARYGSVGWGVALRAGKSRVLFPIMSLDSASNRNYFREYVLKDNGVRCLGLAILLSSHANFLANWESQLLRNLWGLSRPVQGPLCRGQWLVSHHARPHTRGIVVETKT